MTDTHDKDLAKALLGRAVTGEPPLDIDPAALLRTAHRRQTRRRGIVTGSAMLGVVAAASGAMLLVQPAEPKTPVTRPPSTTLPPPTGDERSQRLTRVLADAHLIPPGLAIDGGRFNFGKAIGKSYQASAFIRDSRGSARVIFNLDGEQPITDVTSCTGLRGALSCTARTLPDGSQARVATMPGPVSVPTAKLRRLTVNRSNGTFLEIYVDTAGDYAPTTDGLEHAPSRDEPPLDDETLFRIAQIPGFTY